MSYEFNSTLFRTRAEMCAAIAAEYLSAGGLNSEADQRKFLAESTNAQMADDVIEGWALTGEWAEARNFTREALIEAFAVLRAYQAYLDGRPKETL